MTNVSALPTNARTAEPLWTPLPSEKLVLEDEAALRSTLADRLAALACAREAELAVAARVSVAVREKGEAQGRHAAAAEKTAAARREAASAMQAWLASQDTDRPGSEALSAALAVEATAKVDVEVMESVLGGLKIEHEAAIADTKRALHDAQMIRDRVVLAQACRMAAELNEVDERALELRRSLEELFLALPVKLPVPVGIREAMTPKNIPFNVSSHSPGVRRWSEHLKDLLAPAGHGRPPRGLISPFAGGGPDGCSAAVGKPAPPRSARKRPGGKCRRNPARRRRLPPSVGDAGTPSLQHHHVSRIPPMSEITLNGRAFRLTKLDALTQLAIGVKVLPIVPALKPAFAAAADMRARVAAAEKAAAEGREPDEPIAGAELSDEDVMHLAAAVQALGDDGRNYVIGACLRAVLMETEGGGFMPAWSTRTDTPDPSIDVVTMIRLVYAVVMDNISSFSSQMSVN